MKKGKEEKEEEAPYKGVVGARVAKGTLAPEKANQTNERKGEPGHHKHHCPSRATLAS
jgi:hypothetical protein